MLKVDFIIFGQGLAGTSLAHSLDLKGKSYVIIDNCSKETSSFAAAGICHPISFKRLLLSWKSNLLIPYAEDFYSKIEGTLKTSLYKKHNLYRVFSSVEEQNNWLSKMNDVPYKNYISSSNNELIDSPVLSPYGYGKVSRASRLDVSKYILESRKLFIEKESLQIEDFDFSLIEQKKASFKYKNISCKHFVFCEGQHFINNPFFNYLPSKPSKGETIVIESAEFPALLITKGCFVYPLTKNTFLVGSTYNHEDLSFECTEGGKNELINKLRNIGDFNFKIIHQKAGVRPTTYDRRPVVGNHPEIKNMHILNGLGSKGVMLSPFYSNQLIEHIYDKKAIDSQADVSRYSKKHYHKSTIHYNY